MRSLTAAVAALALFATQALAAEPLAPGKAAGVTKAQDMDTGNMWLYLLGGAAVIAGVALLASGNSNNTVNGGGTTTPPTTTATST